MFPGPPIDHHPDVSIHILSLSVARTNREPNAAQLSSYFPLLFFLSCSASPFCIIFCFSATSKFSQCVPHSEHIFVRIDHILRHIQITRSSQPFSYHVHTPSALIMLRPSLSCVIPMHTSKIQSSSFAALHIVFYLDPIAELHRASACSNLPSITTSPDSQLLFPAAFSKYMYRSQVVRFQPYHTIDYQISKLCIRDHCNRTATVH